MRHRAHTREFVDDSRYEKPRRLTEPSHLDGGSASTPTVVGQLHFPSVSGALASGPASATPDLQRLLASVPDQADGGRSLTVVSDWQQGIGR